MEEKNIPPRPPIPPKRNFPPPPPRQETVTKTTQIEQENNVVGEKKTEGKEQVQVKKKRQPLFEQSKTILYAMLGAFALLGGLTFFLLMFLI